MSASRFAGRNKYGAKKTSCTVGHSHDSKLEANRCDDLHVIERTGAIRNLVVHPQFYFQINGTQLKHENGRRVGYKADFQYFEGDDNIVEDCKGFITKDWPLRKALFRALFPYVTLREIKKRG